MSDHLTPHEPLHQPPDPRDLGAVPPATPECAIVRGRLRDFVDGDLAAVAHRQVEDHVHACRTCAVALSRAEHELLRLRRAFGLIARSEPDAGLPAPGFANRVVSRLVLDETSLLTREMLAAAEKADEKAAEDLDRSALNAGRSGVDGARDRASVSRGLIPQDGLRRGRSSRRASVLRTPTAFLLACVAMLTMLVAFALGTGDADGGQGLHLDSRFVVIAAQDAYSSSGPVNRGSGLGAGEKLWVGVNGKASIDLIDASQKSQPAATLQVTNSGQVCMQGGEPVLEVGRVRVDTRRGVGFVMADGSRVELGVGEYEIVVEDLRGRHLAGEEPKPGELRVAVEVLNGDEALIVRTGMVSTAVTEGQQGVYEGASRVGIKGGRSTANNPLGGLSRTPTIDLDDPDPATLSGAVLEGSGVAAIGSDVTVTFASGGVARSWTTRVGSNGLFEFVTGAVGTTKACDSPFAIVQVVPTSGRDDLGLTAPEVFRLNYSHSKARLATNAIVESSAGLAGQVFDETGSVRGGVHVIPCITDELFQTAWPWTGGEVVSDQEGRFRIARLPGVLPPHQHLDLLLLHPDIEPLVQPVPARNSWQVNVNETFAVRNLQPAVLQLTTPSVGGGSVGGSMPIVGDAYVYEDVVGLPPGAAMVRRRVVANSAGEAQAQVGRGTLWLRQGPANGVGLEGYGQGAGGRAGMSSWGQSGLSQLVLVDLGVPRRFVVENGSSRPVGSVFRQAATSMAAGVMLASSFRFQNYSTSGINQTVPGPVLYVRDALSARSVSDARVFAVRPNGPRDIGESRFLGLTNGSGSLTLGVIAGETIVVVAADGTVGFEGGVDPGSDINMVLRANGEVALDGSVRPAGPAVRMVSVRLQRLDSPVNGVRSEFVRFASVFDDWVLRKVPPGRYLATVNGQSYPVEVPSAGRVTLH